MDRQFTIQRPIMDFDASSDDGDFPQEWTAAVVLGLTKILSIKLGLPMDKELKEMADATIFMAKTYSKENTSTFFQPRRK